MKTVLKNLVDAVKETLKVIELSAKVIKENDEAREQYFQLLLKSDIKSGVGERLKTAMEEAEKLL